MKYARVLGVQCWHILEDTFRYRLTTSLDFFDILHLVANVLILVVRSGNKVEILKSSQTMADILTHDVFEFMAKGRIPGIHQVAPKMFKTTEIDNS